MINLPLTQLEASGLIKLAQIEPDIEYMFRHALIQDVAYESLLRQDRKQLHLAVGEALEHLYAERLGEIAPVLADHFQQGADYSRAFNYFSLAGDYAASKYANTEAITHYQQALNVGPKAQATHDQLAHLYQQHGRLLELIGDYTEALDVYIKMEAFAEAQNNLNMKLTALTERAKIHSTMNVEYDPHKAQELMKEALIQARALNDKPVEAKILWSLLLSLTYGGGDPLEAIEYGEQSAAIARELNLKEQLAYTLADLWKPYWFSGQLVKAKTTFEEGVQLWREIGNIPMIAGTLASYSLCALCSGDYDEAIQLSDESYDMDASVGNAWGMATSLFMIGHVYAERGRYDQAIERATKAIQLAQQVGHMSALASCGPDLAFMYGTLGAVDRGLQLTFQSAEQMQEHVQSFKSWPYSVLSRLYLMKGDVQQAEEMFNICYESLTLNSLLFIPLWVAMAGAELAHHKRDYPGVIKILDELVPRVERIGLRAYMPDAMHIRAKAMIGMGQNEPAYELLQKAQSESEALGSKRGLWPILITRSEIEAECGHDQEASTLRRRAQEIIHYIADHTGFTELSVSFLALPDVQAALEDK